MIKHWIKWFLALLTPKFTVKFRKTHTDAVTPTYAKDGDGAMDLTAIDDGTTNASSDYIAYRTGLQFEIPKGHVGLLFPRSSISTYRLSLANSVGVIDSNFRGEVTMRFRFLSETPSLQYKKGDRIGQLLIIPRPLIQLLEVNELSQTSRGEGGYGSTGQ